MTISETAFESLSEEPGKGILHFFHTLNDAVSVMARELILLRGAITDMSRPVDEEMSGVGSPVQVKPDFDTVDEMITSILVTTPVAAFGVQLTIGNRTLQLPSGVVTLAPLSMLVSRTDQRILSWNGGGTGSVELMGYAAGDAG